MILAALPRFSPARYADVFADRDSTVVWLEITPAEASAPSFATIRKAAFTNAMGARPGCVFAGAFTGGARPPQPQD